MKKILFTMLVVVFCFSVSGPVMAGGPKAPKTLCIEAGGGMVFNLGIKKGVKLTLQDGSKFDMYTLQGALISSPVSGTAYMIDDNLFHFQVGTSGSVNIQVMGVWDVVSQTGQIVLNQTSGSGFESNNYDIYPCGTP